MPILRQLRCQYLFRLFAFRWVLRSIEKEAQAEKVAVQQQSVSAFVLSSVQSPPKLAYCRTCKLTFNIFSIFMEGCIAILRKWTLSARLGLTLFIAAMLVVSCSCYVVSNPYIWDSRLYRLKVLVNLTNFPSNKMAANDPVTMFLHVSMRGGKIEASFFVKQVVRLTEAQSFCAELDFELRLLRLLELPKMGRFQVQVGEFHAKTSDQMGFPCDVTAKLRLHALNLNWPQLQETAFSRPMTKIRIFQRTSFQELKQRRETQTIRAIR